MAGVNAQAPAGTGVASFKVPRPWESNVPKFTTEDKEDLQDFVEQVDDIIGLGQINDDNEKKRLLTSYLPAKKREIWRALTEYAAGTSYADFKKAVLKAYPEMQEDLDGTLEELETLCAENRHIKRSEEGRLKRFGMKFRALVKKLSKAPAIILNKEACRRYLDALERGFAETLRMAINTRNLIKEDLLQAGGERTAGDWALRQRKGENEQRDSGIRNGPQTTYGSDRQFNRGYGVLGETAHINKGWLVVEDGQQKLSDGNYIPRGRGSAAARVEEYWQKKSTVGQHLNETFYGGSAEDEFDVLRDEIRTLRVKLNQVAGGGPPMFQPTPAPVMQLQAQVNPYTNQAAPVPPVNMEELGRTVFNMMRASNSMQDQYVQTRSKGRNVAFAEPPEQDF
ncbi:hypothetical protein B0H14DRAFT_3437099 [Mycena olivaceomarginata]|nr:hypothetical protein B0H14DRAFT_3437099 [Mycena olivaceomarginata]